MGVAPGVRAEMGDSSACPSAKLPFAGCAVGLLAVAGAAASVARCGPGAGAAEEMTS